MEEIILREIREIKTQQLSANNLLIENGNQNTMILSVLKEFLTELQQEQESDGFREMIETILSKLDKLVDKFTILEDLKME